MITRDDILAGLRDIPYMNDEQRSFIAQCQILTKDTIERTADDQLQYWATLQELTHLASYFCYYEYVLRKIDVEHFLRRYLPVSLWALALYNAGFRMNKKPNLYSPNYGFKGKNACRFIKSRDVEYWSAFLREKYLTNKGKDIER